VVALAPAERLPLLLYAGLVLLLLNLAAPNGGLIGIPVLFFLKNRLHLSAHGFATFNLWVGIPLYLSFLFGFLRDRWSPLGAGDRGHLALFGAASAAIYAAIAFTTPSYALLLVGLLVATMTALTAASSATGAFSAVGQEQRMAGQASAVVNTASLVPTVAGALLGGALSQTLEGMNAGAAARALFLVGAALMLAVAVLGLFGPKALFAAHARERTSSPIDDIVRLARHWPVYPPFLLLLLWNFAPALGTVMQYHLANSLHASDAEVGLFYAIYWGSNLPPVLLYAYLCQKAPLSRLLFWGTVVAIPQMLPLLLVHSAGGALLMAVPVGLVGGFVYAALIDLAIRSGPTGLQGTMMMLVVTTTFYVAGRFGDLWGADLYDHAGGFATAVVATTLVYALMLPTLLLVPKRLSATADGEAVA
jgi:MFS family permease